MKHFLVGFLLFLPIVGLASEQDFDYSHPQNLRQFADALYQQEDYLRAAGEYQRYLFYQPQNSDQILYRIAMSYRLGGKTDRALQFFEKLLREYPQSYFAEVARYEIGHSYFLMRQYEQSIWSLRESQNLIHDDDFRWRSQKLIGVSYLMQKQWDNAIDAFDQFDTETASPGVRQTFSAYKKYAADGKQLPTKSPILSGIFSAIVPGTGRIYTGRTGDALVTVFLLGVLGWQSYDGFHRDGTSSTKGWTFGTISGIFYLGNIYGSVVAARVYNRRVEDEFLATISFEFP